jgi:hypothetical protein
LEHREVLAVAGVGLALLIVRLVSVITSSAVVASDSARYRNLADPLSVFDVGAGFGPGVLPQLIFLLPGSAGLAMQTVLSGLIWTGLACLLATNRAGRWLAFVLLGWSTLPWVWLWDSWFLTEALSIPAMAAVFVGSVFSTLERRRDAGFICASVGLLITATARPFLMVVAVPVALAGVLWGRGWRASRSTRNAWIAVLVLTTVFSAWQVEAFESVATRGQSMAALRATDRLWTRWSEPGYLQLARAKGMPDCPDVVKALSDVRGDVSARLRIVRLSRCPGYQDWLARGGLSWTDELLTHPRAVLIGLTDLLYWTRQPIYQYSPYDSRLKWWAATLNESWVPTVSLVNSGILIITGLALVAGMVVSSWRRRWYALAVIALACAGVAGMLLSDGLEYWRHVVPILTGLVPFSLALISVSLNERHSSDQLGRARSGPPAT